MVDKTYVMIMILFLIAGLYGYDRYITNKGQAGPVSKILDLAGLSQYVEDAPVKTVVTYRNYQSSLDSYLKRMDAKRAEIEQQRINMLSKRQSLLEQFKNLNIDIQEMAVTFENTIIKERTDFLEANDELNTLGETLMDIRFHVETESRDAAYKELKEDLLGFINQVTEDPERDIPRVKALFQKIEDIVLVENDALLDNCDDVYVCLKERTDDLEAQLTTMVERMVESPDRDLTALQELTGLIMKEVQLSSDGYESMERNLQENEDQMYSVLKEITMGLSAISGKELRDLLSLYSELEFEHELLLLQLEEEMKSFFEQKESQRRQLDGALEKLIANEAYEREWVGLLLIQTAISQPLPVDEIRKSTNEFKGLLASQSEQNIDFLDKMGAVLEIDWRRFIQDDQYADQHMEFLEQYQENVNAWANHDQGNLQKEIRDRTKENSRALKLLREKARDQRLQH